jgi:hypothetical protein
MNRRRKRRLPFAAYAALVFNAAICLSPFIAARAISTAYGDKRPAFEATSEAMTATRQAIDARFQRLASNGNGAPRDVWSGFVRDELEAGDMTTVNGLLLAAPAMLGPEDGEALKARIAVSDQTGEQALIDAAITYLPEDVQDAYQRRSASIMSMFSNNATPGAVTAAKDAAKDVAKKDAAKDAGATATAQLASAEEEAGHAEFNILGDLRDLAFTAARWARDDRIDEFAFTLAGMSLTVADPEAREGASIALSARRAQRLDADFELYLERKLFEAAPPQELKRLLEGEFQSEYGAGAKGAAVVENVFKSVVDREALESVLADLRVLRDIARDTSPLSAVAILSQVKDGADLRRAKLVAQAGGDRAVALARYDGEHLLDTARTTINWNNALRMQLASLIACLALLGIISLAVFWKSLTRDRPKKVSAVYLMDEPARAR